VSAVLIDVLVVDDSALTRQLMTAVLGRAGGFNVRTAADPLIAMEKMRQARPDVVVLDLEMPRMGGLAFLRKIMAEHPVPIVICSAFAARGTRNAMQALEDGAVDVFSKPSVGLKEFFTDAAGDIVEILRGAAQAKVRRRRPSPRLGAERRSASAVMQKPVLPPRVVPGNDAVEVIAIGASAGGTEAIREIVTRLPPDLPPIVIVQHIPAEFVAPLVSQLDTLTPVTLRVATSGERLQRGTALFAPGDKHLAVMRRRDELVTELIDGPRVSHHRPSVDVLFRSVATSAGARAVGIILTGMGSDGADGLVEMRNFGARTIAQDSATCVVFGMPREAIARGGAEIILPLGKMATAITELAGRR
jgi:two-component system chemotaxis response regulator CheB